MNIPEEVVEELKLYLAARAQQEDSYAYRLLTLIERLAPEAPQPTVSFAVPPSGEELDC